MASNKINTYTPDEFMAESEKGFNFRSLETPRDVLFEMNVIYKLSRKGKMETQDYARYVNGLNSMVGVMRDTDIEERMKALEESSDK